MNNRSRDRFHPQDEIERRLTERLGTLAAEVSPREAFADRLEADLLGRWERLARASQPREAGRDPVRFLSRHRWAAAAAALLVVATVVLSVLGPQRVWADLLHLLGYVPGVGFVDLEGMRVLAAPVEVTREGVTLRVEQVLAGSKGTTVVIGSEGLPPQDRSTTERAGEGTGLEPTLHLPDGSTLTPRQWDVRRGVGTIQFPPLPEGVYRVTLAVPRLPLVWPGEAPEGWSVPLALRPATGELVAELFPQPYAPAGAIDTHEGVALRVLAVAHTAEETVLQVRVQWRDAAWYFPHLGFYRPPRLEDDLGHVYHEGPPPGVGSEAARVVEQIEVDRDATPTPAPALPSYEEAISFAPVSPAAARLTLWVDHIEFTVPVEEEFGLDLGSDPQVGDRWPLDVELMVAGFPVHMTGARLVEERVPDRDGTVLERQLQFEIEPVEGQEERELHSICLEGRVAGFSGAGCGGGGTDRPPHLDIEAGRPTPTGHVRVQLRAAYVLFRGPWQLDWTVPGTGETGAAPATLRPEHAAETRSGVTLIVDEVVRTDRLTAVQIEGETSLPGATLGWDAPMWGAPDLTLSWDPAARDATGQRVETRYLYDARGRRYGRVQGTTWQSPGESDKHALEPAMPGVSSETLFLEALQPFARRVTLHVPAVAATLPGAAAFEVDVPPGRAMHPDAQTPEPVSDPWAVDIPLEVGSYRMRLVEAQLREISGRTRLVLTADPVEGRRRDQWLAGFRLAKVTGPRGRVINLADAYATAGPDGQGDGAYRAWVALDVTDPATGALQAGRYRVELDGVLVAVEGPWELTWTLP